MGFKPLEYPEAPTNFCGIYCLFCFENNKFYIGSAQNFKRRKADHICKLNKKSHANRNLQNSWNKYGERAFKWLKIEECLKDVIFQREQHYIDASNCLEVGFNINKDAVVPTWPKGKKRSEANRIKSSRVRIGSKLSEATKRAISRAHTGKPLSESHKINISKALKGKRPSNATIDAAKNANSKFHYLLSPEGKVLEIYNLLDFCRKNNLAQSHIYDVKIGKSSQHKGYRAYSPVNTPVI